jgi:hypothetical protein
MTREDPHELLARVAGRAGDGDARDRSGVSPGRAVGGVVRRGDNMHQKEYLYTTGAAESTKIDVD